MACLGSLLSCPPCKATAAPPPASASAPTAAEADPDPCNRDHARLARLVSRSGADQFRDLSTRKFRRQQGRIPQRDDSTSRAWQSACLRVDLSHPSPPMQAQSADDGAAVMSVISAQSSAHWRVAGDAEPPSPTETLATDVSEHKVLNWIGPGATSRLAFCLQSVLRSASASSTHCSGSYKVKSTSRSREEEFPSLAPGKRRPLFFPQPVAKVCLGQMLQA